MLIVYFLFLFKHLKNNLQQMIAEWGEMRASLTGPTQFRTSLACFAICSSDSSLDVSAIIMGVDSKSLPANKQKNNDAAASQYQIWSFDPTNFHCS